MKSAYKIRLIYASIIFVFAMLGISGVSSACLFDNQFALLLQRVFVNFSIIVLILFFSIDFYNAGFWKNLLFDVLSLRILAGTCGIYFV